METTIEIGANNFGMDVGVATDCLGVAQLVGDFCNGLVDVTSAGPL